MRTTARMTVLLGVFIGLFGMLGIRLWFVQIAEGAVAAEATDTQAWVRIATPAPRGDIYDARGNLLATSRFVPVVEVDRHLVERDQAEGLIRRLSSLLAIPESEIAALYDAAGANGVFEIATVDSVDAYQINEQLRDFPGVRIKRVPERINLVGGTMAHVLGHLGLPTQADLEERPDLDPNTRIGKLGVERVYDEWLQGIPGQLAYRVQRAEITEQQPEVAPVPGNSLYLTLDLALQEVVERALAEGIVLSNEWKADQRAQGRDGGQNITERGAAVVLDVRTGKVLAMASYPTFDPGLFVSGLDANTFAALNESGALRNLAVSGMYPPASTFKAVTYMTILEDDVPLPASVEGVDANSRVVHCDGRLELPTLSDGSPQVRTDWYAPQDKGWLDLSGAFEQSCNIWFWSAALGIYQQWDETPRETVLQDMARELGYGSRTGIDLTGDAAGIVPDRDLFLRWQEAQLEDPDAPRLLDASRLELSDPWFGGDLMNVAIGQGSLVATPLQVAVSYAAMVNGGTVWQPYVVDQIRDVNDALVYVNSPTVRSQVDLSPGSVTSLLTDLNRVVTRGTAASAFADFGASIGDVGGKTGTGQSIASADNHAWFVGVVGINDPRYVVAVLIDEGGSGGAVAAPVARQIMQYLKGEELTPITAGAAAQ
ncbi:MAG: penicillin-binding transpeptidase domain-containing protein [Acidimicrobiia bacterium]|nr:penicillin-binding transpeptidase domain-containing protein [Acidimicrobiia bacterium]